MTRRGEVRRSVARGQSGFVLGEVETLEWATRIGFEARLANTRLRIFWVTEDAQHPGALPALEAKNAPRVEGWATGMVVIGDSEVGGDKHATLNAIGAFAFLLSPPPEFIGGGRCEG